MTSDADDDQPHHREEQDESTEGQPSDHLWSIALGSAELSALYFSYKGNEGAAQIAQALVLVIQMLRALR
ncbi:hypothetical protein [Actinoplanes teichomyceticus]|uniref:Uncharacterized protein n=1 Tax=Actinoplanes teichomyceticus TaxID=1867 RepID=A0A561VQP1_ACTTI|nr:hypothetical protein [Actinoplanes teichomyceticus]TWG13934.1 hypothetical protein FHX34_104227 [Actinoplanes teichomyceticus]GIF12242.1 hypothetical protein Ate01nite_22740 [Actinoplanes teichomyceticus]